MFKTFNFFGVIFGGLKDWQQFTTLWLLVFAVSLVLAIVMWWKEAGIFVFPEDLDWIMTAGGYLWHVDKVPETGKYNPGQKMFFLTVALCAFNDSHGFFMWYPTTCRQLLWIGSMCFMCWALW